MWARFLLLIPVIFFTGCASDIATDYSSQFNFETISTYQLVIKADAESLDDNRVKEAIARQLDSRGLVQVKSSADIVVRHSIEKQSDVTARGPTFGFGYGHRNVGIGISSPQRYEERTYGKLVVEMIEPERNQVIWRSISNRKLTANMAPAKRNEFIQGQIGKMFDQFPPS